MAMRSHPHCMLIVSAVCRGKHKESGVCFLFLYKILPTSVDIEVKVVSICITQSGLHVCFPLHKGVLLL